MNEELKSPETTKKEEIAVLNYTAHTRDDGSQ